MTHKNSPAPKELKVIDPGSLAALRMAVAQDMMSLYSRCFFREGPKNGSWPRQTEHNAELTRLKECATFEDFFSAFLKGCSKECSDLTIVELTTMLEYFSYQKNSLQQFHNALNVMIYHGRFQELPSLSKLANRIREGYTALKKQGTQLYLLQES